MDFRIGGERPGDEEAIDAVLCRAFGAADEAQIVRDMRAHYPAFDCRFSVAAWAGDEMVGHTLFSPARLRLRGRTIPALAVGPVAVVPPLQRRGIGAQMLCYGHELGKKEGFALAFLMGHPAYYPRHGYRPCFGHGRVKIDLEKLPRPSLELQSWPVLPADLPWLAERLEAELEEVDFGWLWGTSLSAWCLSGINALVWRTADGRRAAYTMGAARRRNQLDLLLADDPELARQVIFRLRPERLEHHPSGWLARQALDPTWAQATAGPSQAAMAFELREGALAPYLKALEQGRAPGHVNWPLPFVAH